MVVAGEVGAVVLMLLVGWLLSWIRGLATVPDCFEWEIICSLASSISILISEVTSFIWTLRASLRVSLRWVSSNLSIRYATVWMVLIESYKKPDPLEGIKYLEKLSLLCLPGEPVMHQSLSICLLQISALLGISKPDRCAVSVGIGSGGSVLSYATCFFLVLGGNSIPVHCHNGCRTEQVGSWLVWWGLQPDFCVRFAAWTVPQVSIFLYWAWEKRVVVVVTGQGAILRVVYMEPFLNWEKEKHDQLQ